MISKLALQFYEDYNSTTLTIIDRSIYNEDITVGCERLLITLPGFVHPITVPISTGFNEAFTAYDLKLTNRNNSNLMKLPDGLYIINYSICPNDEVYVEYNYLRQTETYKKYFKKLCSLQLLGCEEKKSTAEIIKKLQTIDMYLQAAKAYVEECGAPVRGLELHAYANKLLDKLNIDCNCK